jgi:4-amino-4-deoxy-L-arabinose transferase-like glycosyltransferase
MRKKSPPAKLKISWISGHPRVVIGVILVACLGPFVNKAIHVDDMFFVWVGEWIQQHPINFYGFEVNTCNSTIPMWQFNYNPPLMSYFLAGVASLFGWHEIVLHLACLAVAFMAAAGIYSLARMWCDRPLLATAVAIFTPVFLVSSTTLMCDVPMLAFWIWALVFWERALTSNEQSRWQFVGAGVLAGLAMLTKYSAVILLPLLPVLSLLRTRKPGWWLAGLAVPLLMVAGYEWLTARLYGTGLLFASTRFVSASCMEFPGGWKAKGIISLAFAGGSLLPLLFFAPWLWRRRVLLAGGVVIFGILLGTFRSGRGLGLLLPWANLELLNHWDFLLQVGLLTAAGLHLFLFVGAEAWQRRNIISMTLALWIISGLLLPIMLNWTVCARRFLPIVPAVAILLVRRLGATRGNSLPGDWWLWPLVPAAAITLSVVIADYQLANSVRIAAQQITAKYKSTGYKLWFEGGYGTFQYYMEKLGGQRIDVERSSLQPGDIVVVPCFNNSFVTLPAGGVGWVEHLAYQPDSWMNSYGSAKSGAAGFYGADMGPVPFAIGRLPMQDYFVVKVFSRIQFNMQPANPQEALAGDVPDFRDFSGTYEHNLIFREGPEVSRQTQLAIQLETDGRIEEAIQHYREALNVDSNNPVVLNNLAWILATASKPELRNGEEAVQLATKAVELTDRRLPILLGTLAVTYAEAGQFSKADAIAFDAKAFAKLTGRKVVLNAVDKNALLNLYSSGKAVDATNAP